MDLFVPSSSVKNHHCVSARSTKVQPGGFEAPKVDRQKPFEVRLQTPQRVASQCWVEILIPLQAMFEQTCWYCWQNQRIQHREASQQMSCRGSLDGQGLFCFPLLMFCFCVTPAKKATSTWCRRLVLELNARRSQDLLSHRAPVSWVLKSNGRIV